MWLRLLLLPRGVSPELGWRLPCADSLNKPRPSYICCCCPSALPSVLALFILLLSACFCVPFSVRHLPFFLPAPLNSKLLPSSSTIISSSSPPSGRAMATPPPAPAPPPRAFAFFLPPPPHKCFVLCPLPLAPLPLAAIGIISSSSSIGILLQNYLS